ncbi:MAG: LapA family protein [Syntrophobacteraceae bacterium]|nr:LapA family protein [Syntrophobacteraceae bacterium]
MRLFKLITGGLIVLIIGLFIYQNVPTFKSSIPFSFDMFIREKVTGEFSLYSLLLSAGIIGVLLGVFLMLKPYFNVRRLLAQERSNKQPADTSGESAASSSHGTPQASAEKQGRETEDPTPGASH